MARFAAMLRYVFQMACNGQHSFLSPTSFTGLWKSFCNKYVLQDRLVLTMSVGFKLIVPSHLKKRTIRLWRSCLQFLYVCKIISISDESVMNTVQFRMCIYYWCNGAYKRIRLPPAKVWTSKGGGGEKAHFL